MGEATLVNLMYPILPFMSEFFIKKSYSPVPEYLISQYSGYLEGSFRVTQFLACIWMSALSDKIGRRPIMIITLFSRITFSICLGFATTFEAAVTIRLLSGFFSGSIPVMKSFMREISDDITISKLYAANVLGNGIANVLGPLLSTLANPASNLGWIFKNAFFEQYPYFLPLFLNSLISAVALVLVLTVMPKKLSESEGKKKKLKELCENRMYFLVVFMFGMQAIIQSSAKLLFSLYCKSKTDVGGIGIESEEKVATVQTAAGVIVMILPALFTQFISLKLGLIRAIIVLLCCYLPLLAVIVCLGYLPRVLMIFTLCTSFGVFFSVSQVLGSYISICISNTVTSDLLGRANGLSQAFVAITRAISSPIIGHVYGWSVSDGLEFMWINARFTFYLLLIFIVFNTILAVTSLNKSIEKKKVAGIIEENLMNKRE